MFCQGWRYNIFIPVNMSNNPIDELANIFRLLGQPVRMRILLVLGRNQACVCHIEALLGIRQAAISQHLIVLRRHGLVETVREGRHIFYRLAKPDFIDIIFEMARKNGLPSGEMNSLAKIPVQDCTCPYCNPDMDPNLTCK